MAVIVDWVEKRLVVLAQLNDPNKGENSDINNMLFDKKHSQVFTDSWSIKSAERKHNTVNRHRHKKGHH